MVIINNKNSSKTLQTIFIISLFAISLVAWELVVIQVEAGHNFNTISLGTGINTITLRDFTNSANNTATVSINKSTFNPGENVTVTVTDDAANFDPDGIDIVFSSASSTTSGATTATTTLTETSANSAIFTGTIILNNSATTSGSTLEINSGDDVSVFYDPADDPWSSRFKAVITTTGPTSVTISDVIFPDATIDPCPLNPILHGVDLDFANPSVVTDIDVSFRYGNSLQGDPALFLDNLLRIGYRSVSTSGFTEADALNPINTGQPPASTGHDFGAKIVSSTIQPSSPEGQYALGFFTGCTGGGGGGLVRPGLVVNALAGISAALGGGGSGPPGPTITLGAVALHDSASETISMPQEIRDFLNNDFDPKTPLEPMADTYEDFDLPLSINGNGFALGGYENTLVTQTIQPGVPNEFQIVFYTNSEIAHTSLYFNLGPTKTIGGSDTQVLLYKDQPVEIIDPNGNIATATGTINNQGELKRVVTFSITFSDDIQWSDSDLIIRSWNDDRNSGDTIVYDAINVLPSEEEIAFEENIPEPEVEQLKSQHVPIWIKNNAAWWSQELIEDEDFVAGIEYLIQNKIITIQDNQVIASSYSSNEIPDWIKNTAGWWSENQITEKEFIDGIQWLISNGIIKVVET